MFAIGDYIVYGTTGVCKVEAIGRLQKDGFPADVEYYTLAPSYVKGSTIYARVEGTKVLMRPVMTRSEIDQLIAEIEAIEPLVVTDEKKREEIYREVLKSGDLRKIISAIKLLCKRKEERLLQGKKVTASDDKYFKLAEDSLLGELAIVLGMDKASVREYLNHFMK